MSYIVTVERKSEEPTAISKYEICAFRTDSAWALGPFDFELERKSILTDFEGLGPVMLMGSVSGYLALSSSLEPSLDCFVCGALAAFLS
jgi:hypothetical protein